MLFKSLHGYLSFSNTPISSQEYPLSFPIQVHIQGVEENKCIFFSIHSNQTKTRLKRSSKFSKQWNVCGQLSFEGHYLMTNDQGEIILYICMYLWYSTDTYMYVHIYIKFHDCARDRNSSRRSEGCPLIFGFTVAFYSSIFGFMVAF